MGGRRSLGGRFVLIGAAMAAALAGAVWPLIGAVAPDEDAAAGALAALAVMCAGLVHLWVFVDGRVLRPLSAEADAAGRRLEAVLRGLDEGVIVCAADHRITHYNEAAARSLGDALGRGRPVGAVLDPAAIEGALGGLDPAAARVEDTAGRTFRITRIAEGAGNPPGYAIIFAGMPGEVARQAGFRYSLPPGS